MDIMPYFY